MSSFIPPSDKQGDGRADFLSALRVVQEDYTGLQLGDDAFYQADLVELAKWGLTRYQPLTAELKVPATAAAGSFYEVSLPPLPREGFILSHVQLVTNKQVGIELFRNATANDINGYANIAFRTQFSATIDYAFHFIENKYENGQYTELIRFAPVLNVENVKHYELSRSLRDSLPRFYPWPVGGDGRRNNWRAQLELGVGSAPGEDVDYYCTIGIHTALGAPAK